MSGPASCGDRRTATVWVPAAAMRGDRAHEPALDGQRGRKRVEQAVRERRVTAAGVRVEVAQRRRAQQVLARLWFGDGFEHQSVGEDALGGVHRTGVWIGDPALAHRRNPIAQTVISVWHPNRRLAAAQRRSPASLPIDSIPPLRPREAPGALDLHCKANRRTHR